MNRSKKLLPMKLKFHDGREKPIPLTKMAIFENNSVYHRLYGGEETDLRTVIEEIGLCALDFKNVHEGSEDITDIDIRSTRLFTIWGENSETGEVVGLIRGFVLLLPFSTPSPPDWYEFYSLRDTVPMYPMAIISSIRAISLNRENWDEFITQLLKQISLIWQKVRKKTISRLPEGSPLWKRYIFSFEDIIHFSFTCPSIDREIIEVLKRRGFRITGFLQLLSSPSPVYDHAAIDHHIKKAQKIVNLSE